MPYADLERRRAVQRDSARRRGFHVLGGPRVEVAPLEQTGG